MGLQQYGCYMCLWQSRKKNRYGHADWPFRTSHVVGKENQKSKPLILQNRILLPPLHIKLGIVKNFITSILSNLSAAERLHTLFPNLSGMKLKAGVLTGPDIKKLVNDEIFAGELSLDQLGAWNAVKAVLQSFLG